MKISGYRLMWLLTMFDLPVETRENRRDYRRFVDYLEDDGFLRMQFSVYIRPCATEENTEVHVARVLDHLPPMGEVRILKFTDKQWARMIIYRERQRTEAEVAPDQFSFFDESLRPIVSSEPTPDIDHQLAVNSAESPPVDLLAILESTTRKIATRSRRQASHKKKRESSPSFDFFD